MKLRFQGGTADETTAIKTTLTADLGKGFLSLCTTWTSAAGRVAAPVTGPRVIIINTKLQSNPQDFGFRLSGKWSMYNYRLSPIQTQNIIHFLNKINCTIPVTVFILGLGPVKDVADAYRFSECLSGKTVIWLASGFSTLRIPCLKASDASAV